MVKSVDGLGNGHDLLSLDVVPWVKVGVDNWNGMDEVKGRVRLCGNIEGGNDSRRRVCLAMRVNSN